MYWWWDDNTTRFREMVVNLTIHNNPESFVGRNGIYLMVFSGRISGHIVYFGFQTDMHLPGTRRTAGKGVIFSRWGTRDLDNVRLAQNGFSESSGHEGDFIGARKGYNWRDGHYSLRLAPDGTDPDGEWFGLWVTESRSGNTTWMGSLKFPYVDNEQRATIYPQAYSAIEVYGDPQIRPIDIPELRVNVDLPRADGQSATRGLTAYSTFHGEILNSEARFDHATGSVFLQAGGLTQRLTPERFVYF